MLPYMAYMGIWAGIGCWTGHGFFYLKALNDKCSTCCVVAEKIILDIHYFKPLQVSAIHVFLAEKPNLDPGVCSLIRSYMACWGIWAGICRWTTDHCILPLCTTGHLNSCESVNRVLRIPARYTKPFVLNGFKIKRRAFSPMP